MNLIKLKSKSGIENYINIDKITMIRKHAGNSKLSIIEFEKDYYQIIEMSVEELMEVINEHSKEVKQ